MNPETISQVASLLGDPTRARIMTALICGKALSATELSLFAEVTAQTASSHLAKLLEDGLVKLRKQGRHRYYQIASREVAAILETLGNLAPVSPDQVIETGPTDPDLRRSRFCYDHLAGELSVQLHQALVANELLEEYDEQLFINNAGRDFFASLGADIDALEKQRRPLCRNCLDWSERRFHLAGALGQWVLDYTLEKRWARRDLDSRIIRFSDSGLNRFSQTFLRRMDHACSA